jgi:microcystin-dependent protein
MVSFKHKFVSAKADGGDSTLVKPTNWNDEHDVIAAADGVVLGVPAGAGASAPIQEMPISSVFPAGFVAPFAGSVAPSGWLICDGSLHNRSDLPALFTAIGTAYNTGGEATTQFRIPDVRGRVIAGVDGGVGRLGSYISGALASTGGQESEQSYADVSVSGVNSITVGGTLTGVVHANATAGSGSGAGSLAGDNAPVVVSGNLSGNNNIGASGGGNTRVATNIQPMIVMNMMIKT